MKISCVAINSNLISSNMQTIIIDFLKNKLYEIGEKISSISYFDCSLDDLNKSLNSNDDMIFLIGNNFSIYNKNIKDNLSKILNDKLDINNDCMLALKKYCSIHNMVFSMQEENECNIPSKAIPICSENYYNNGFFYNYNNKIICFLPCNLEFIKLQYETIIHDLISQNINADIECITLKCFGILEQDIMQILGDIVSNEIEIETICDELDATIYLRYNKNTNQKMSQNIISEVCNRLNKYIYATDNSTIFQTACDLLNIQGKHLAIGETLTYGNINKMISMIDGNIIKDGFVFNNYDTIFKQINIEKKIIDKFGHYSANTVYELANALLEKTNAQIALFVLGDINADICYMAIGDINGIHVYKNKINIQNNNLIENLSKTAIFYLIKKLKQNDLLM